MYIKRDIEEKIIVASKEFASITLYGARQVGKSTLLSHIFPNIKMITLDDIEIRDYALRDPKGFIKYYSYPLIIDEFQREPDILLKIKDIVDKLGYEGKENKGLFWLTGSQKFLMMKNVSETLAGRVALFEMSGLSQQEIDGNDLLFTTNIEELKTRTFIKKDVHEVFENIFRGGLPQVICSDIDKNRYYENYVNLYLERDIHDLEKVGKLDDFYNFLVFMAARTAQELKYDEISKQIGVSAPTIKSWVTILERSGIVFILKPYFNKITDRMTKIPKLYFMDTGLAAYLCRWPNAETLENGPMDGAFFETFVVSEIVKSYMNHGKSTRDIYYYRDLDKREIDMIIEDATSITPIEIKKNKMPNHPDKNFGALSKFNKNLKPGLIICLSDELKPYNNNCWYCPITLL